MFFEALVARGYVLYEAVREFVVYSDTSEEKEDYGRTEIKLEAAKSKDGYFPRRSTNTTSFFLYHFIGSLASWS